MDRITFNTHRPYTAEGQVIVAEVWGVAVLFHDTSRMVMGSIAFVDEIEVHEVTRWPHRFMRFVLDAYDHGNYTGISSAEAPKRLPNETIHHYS